MAGAQVKSKLAGRPNIETITDGKELKRWYWRKDELADHARRVGIKVSGAKFDLLDRIAHLLDTGERQVPAPKPARPTSKFDWHSAELNDDTVITDSYRNSQNVRRYFKARVGENFKFNIAFMEWMKANEGKTLADACAAYVELRSSTKQTRIKDHNQYNQYMRDFLADNPSMGPADVRRIWALKIQLPSESGRHRYDPMDINLESQ